MISFILRGPIYPSTHILICQLFFLFKDIEVILSTWESEKDKMEFPILPHKILVNNDPGIDRGGSNINRILISTNSGLYEASHKMSCVLRTDLMVYNTNFVRDYINNNNKPKTNNYVLFNDRILISNVYTTKPDGEYKLPFHPGDWFHFGRTDDIKTLFNVPLKKEGDRLRPEQHLLVNLLRSKYNQEFIKYDEDVSEESTRITYEVIKNNFIVTNIPFCGIWNTKYPLAENNKALISHQDWLNLF